MERAIELNSIFVEEILLRHLTMCCVVFDKRDKIRGHARIKGISKQANILC